jgi:hypothetical protein
VWRDAAAGSGRVVRLARPCRAVVGIREKPSGGAPCFPGAQGASAPALETVISVLGRGTSEGVCATAWGPAKGGRTIVGAASVQTRTPVPR